MKTATLLEARSLRKHFGPVRAVDCLDLSVERGRTLALVGESGCGKTTTAKLILRLERPSSGQVLIDGEDVHTLQGGALRRFRMRVQAVFQDPWSSLNPPTDRKPCPVEPCVTVYSYSGSAVLLILWPSPPGGDCLLSP